MYLSQAWVDLPNGRYHVFLNIDSPSGFWGEYQVYRRRTVTANGTTVVDDTMDLPRFLQKYFRFAEGAGNVVLQPDLLQPLELLGRKHRPDPRFIGTGLLEYAPPPLAG